MGKVWFKRQKKFNTNISVKAREYIQNQYVDDTVAFPYPILKINDIVTRVAETSREGLLMVDIMNELEKNIVVNTGKEMSVHLPYIGNFEPRHYYKTRSAEIADLYIRINRAKDTDGVEYYNLYKELREKISLQSSYAIKVIRVLKSRDERLLRRQLVKAHEIAEKRKEREAIKEEKEKERNLERNARAFAMFSDKKNRARERRLEESHLRKRCIAAIIKYSNEPLDINFNATPTCKLVELKNELKEKHYEAIRSRRFLIRRQK